MLREKDKVINILTYLKRTQIPRIQQSMKDSINRRNITPEFIIDLKNALENELSILDYIYNDFCHINKDNISVNLDKNIYFPISENENDFNNMMRKHKNEFKSKFPEIYNLIESIQPHKLNDLTIFNLKFITNIKKHLYLIPIEVRQTKEKSIEKPEGTIRIFEGPDSKALLDQAMNNQDKIVGKSENKIWTSFVFKDTKIDAMNLLHSAFKVIRNFFNNISPLIYK